MLFEGISSSVVLSGGGVPRLLTCLENWDAGGGEPQFFGQTAARQQIAGAGAAGGGGGWVRRGPCGDAQELLTQAELETEQAAALQAAIVEAEVRHPPPPSPTSCSLLLRGCLRCPPARGWQSAPRPSAVRGVSASGRWRVAPPGPPGPLRRALPTSLLGGGGLGLDGDGPSAVLRAPARRKGRQPRCCERSASRRWGRPPPCGRPPAGWSATPGPLSAPDRWGGGRRFADRLSRPSLPQQRFRPRVLTASGLRYKFYTQSMAANFFSPNMCVKSSVTPTGFCCFRWHIFLERLARTRRIRVRVRHPSTFRTDPSSPPWVPATDPRKAGGQPPDDITRKDLIEV